jgi:purine-binding chemotaxis protein CheW
MSQELKPVGSSFQLKEVKEEENGKNSSYRTMQLIVFKIGHEEYGLVIDQIKEVVITPNISKIPLTPNYIKGVANVRGNILAIIDLSERFGLNAASEKTPVVKQQNYTLVVESEDFKMGILVKEVPNTLTVTQSDIDQSPNVISEGNSEKNYIKGIVKSGERMIILIDVFKIISKDEVNGSILNKV